MKQFAPALLVALVLSLSGSPSVVAASSPAPSPMAHDATHPVVMEHEAQQVATSKVGPVQPFVAPAALPAVGGAGGPQREVFGFGLASSLSDPTVGYPSWNFSLLSTVAYFGLHVNDDGTIASDSGWTVWNSSQLTGLLSTAHAWGTKVVVTIILQDFTSGTPHMCAGLSHYSTTVAAILAEVTAKGVDGVNVDYEGLNGSCGSQDSSWARHMLSNFVSTLRSSLPSGSYLSVDTYASSAADPLGFFDVPTLNRFADSFFVMAYDLEYSNYLRPPLSCSSFCLGPTAPLAGYYYNDNNTAAQYVAAVPASKVILGVPYYGRKACVATATPNQYPTSDVVADSYLDAAGEPTSPEVQSGSYATHRDANDPAGQERWDTWVNTTLSCTRELYWDDINSLGPKYDLVNNLNLRGVGIWNLNYGGGAPELWNELRAKFATQWNSLGGSLTSGAGPSSCGASNLDAFVLGGNGAVWFKTWNGTIWSGWNMVGGNVTGNPSAVCQPGTNVIDLFVEGTDGHLYHKNWNGSAWLSWENLGGSLSSSPAAVSCSAGKLDVFVLGGGGVPWRKSFNGTSWGPWTLVGGYLNDQPGAACEPGTNAIDLFARGNDAALWYRHWDGSTWQAWVSLGGSLSSGPAASSCAAGKYEAFLLGGDGVLWRKTFNGTSWSGWTLIGGHWTSNPGAVCRPGTTNIDLFERGSDYGLWQMDEPE